MGDITQVDGNPFILQFISTPLPPPLLKGVWKNLFIYCSPNQKQHHWKEVSLLGAFAKQQAALLEMSKNQNEWTNLVLC